MVVHLEKRHKNHLRFYRVVVQNMIIDSGHYQHCKCECPDQVHNKIKTNIVNVNMILKERKQSKGIVYLHIK